MEEKPEMKACFEYTGEKDDGSGKMLPFWVACLIGIVAAGAVIVVFKMIIG
jgi:hypothetical protein